MDTKYIAQLNGIHNLLCSILVSGDGAVAMGDCIKALRCMVTEMKADMDTSAAPPEQGE